MAGDRHDWTHLPANVARIVDLLDYWLNAEYARWITDPESDEYQAEMKARRKAGWKPPPRPIIPPVAHRPPSVAEAELTEFQRQVDEHATAHPKLQVVERGGRQVTKRMVSSDEWDALLGL